MLRARGARAASPIVGVSEGESLPYVLDTDLVCVRPGEGLPVEAIARALARALGADGVGLAARLPVLRGAGRRRADRGDARAETALIAAAVFVPGADLPVLTLNELRLVLRIALASGGELGPGALPELARRARRRLRLPRSSRARSATALPRRRLRRSRARSPTAATRAVGEAARAPLRAAA